ncbi:MULTISPECIES: hypothetical protein [Rhizobium]|uniref:Uncharacterized protein n=1 Tax=Rhizobium etli TaxID=29449 RepID=A0A7W6ZNS7_RHIET|nr:MULTISPECIES: hypothetical protein [Rhizobium]MBB4483212.1 hypothetical protein [Rhizobium etli]MBB4539040.1 hypothetical protein [Rhizobium etli]PDT07433.1 hypothetical protein CO655_26920 [Rhizobium sp. M1]
MREGYHLLVDQEMQWEEMPAVPWEDLSDEAKRAIEGRAKLNNRKRGLRVETGVIQEKCLISYDDSHQIHSVHTVIEWNYQKVVTTMKKLEHCYKLTLTGPVTDFVGEELKAKFSGTVTHESHWVFWDL